MRYQDLILYKTWLLELYLFPVKSANLADLIWCLNFEHIMFLEHIVLTCFI